MDRSGWLRASIELPLPLVGAPRTLPRADRVPMTAGHLSTSKNETVWAGYLRPARALKPYSSTAPLAVVPESRAVSSPTDLRRRHDGPYRVNAPLEGEIDGYVSAPMVADWQRLRA